MLEAKMSLLGKKKATVPLRSAWALPKLIYYEGVGIVNYFCANKTTVPASEPFFFPGSSPVFTCS